MSISVNWSNQIRVLMVLLCACVGLSACGKNSPKTEEPTPVLSKQPNTTFPMPPLKTGKGLSEMGWILTQGDRVTISNYRDKVLVLDLYATWCMPCRESIPHLVDLQKRYGPDGLAIVGLNVGGPDDRVAVPAFAREFRITYTLGFPERELSDLLLSDSDAIPQTFVFNRQGQLTRRFIGYGESTASELEGTIRSAINTRAD